MFYRHVGYRRVTAWRQGGRDEHNSSEDASRGRRGLHNPGKGKGWVTEWRLVTSPRTTVCIQPNGENKTESTSSTNKVLIKRWEWIKYIRGLQLLEKTIIRHDINYIIVAHQKLLNSDIGRQFKFLLITALKQLSFVRYYVRNTKLE